ncbi:uncharacterized protein MYCFIDRAFT_185572 [Pseudocercospora fijiensis CIRAD86]|uniref:DNA polymerase epsilon subunit D n=1 Tax=Pseudocercospora fijiensis (strain CIRAD86) TaxID=383855 RepID=N1QCD8_PSEFD|nr:uncharacterized protein MYCFIDRAFT_185572 [Pseudocercospora fijiensis CIRAD86]EME89177.1 hypothetical protein MYCFIDRAFT_185572 [Pseudocercospora fijiensis CIRAD86]
MPGRKSNVSTTSNGPEEVVDTTPSAPKQSKEKEGFSVDVSTSVVASRSMLTSPMILRLAKGVLPANTQIHKDALLSMHKSATVFVSYIASNSNDNAQAGGKKTISPQDVMAALKDAELEGFLPRLEAELKKYNETQCDKRNTYRRKVKEEKAAAAAKDGTDADVSMISKDGEAAKSAEDGAVNHEGDDEDAGRPAKKLKGANGSAAAPQMSDDVDDDDGDDEQEAEDNDDDADEDGAEDDVPDEESDDGDQTMEDALEEQPDRRALRDEALDDPDSD